VPAPKKAGEDQAIGRSRGGLSTKIHTLVDALGNPLGFFLTAARHTTSWERTNLLPTMKAENGCSEDLPYSQAQIPTARFVTSCFAEDPTQERRQDARLLERGRGHCQVNRVWSSAAARATMAG
jgi:hypothetical protein